VSSTGVPLARLQLLGAAILFSTGGAAIKSTALTAWQVASFRSGIAALALLLLLPAARRAWSPRILLVALAYAATLTLFVLANRLTTAANTIFLQSTAPLYILLLGPWLLKEPVRRSDLAFMGALAVGLALFFVSSEAPAATAPDPFAGNVLATLSGVCWALTVVGLRWLGAEGKGEAGVATVAMGNVVACLATLPMALPVAAVELSDWVIVGYLGVFQIAGAYVLLTSGIRHVPALEASTILLVEPALNPIWAWLVHAETPSRWALAGGGVILGAMVVKLLHDRRAHAPPRVVPPID
jgi:drug/metabolite transporter, DME family